MSLKVIGAGLGRTGTHSLALALEKLGFGPCYTVNDLKKNPSHVDLWHEAIAAKKIDWDRLYQSYQSAVEWPTVSFLAQLIPHYSEAKVILTLRDPEAWYESANTTIFDALEWSHYKPNPSGVKKRNIELIRHLILDIMFAGQYRDKAYAIKVYQQHIDQVMALVPPNRLLQYQITDGWQPLCAFLERPEPPEPFPQVNDRASFLASAPAWFKALSKRFRRRQPSGL